MILVLDNLDSFTFNLVLYLRELGAEVLVVRADELTPADALATGASGFLISPGPGRPENAGSSIGLVRACADGGKPLLGVCLGHQAIGAAFGAEVVRAEQAMHGKTSIVTHDGTGIFAGLPSPLIQARYHSLVLRDVPEDLVGNAEGSDRTIQGLRHRELPIHGVQFHPESIASEHGYDLLRNFLGICGAAQA